MAKKRKGSKAGNSAMPFPSRNRVNVGIEEAENGYVVNTSSEGKHGYESKTLVAPHGRAALRIANQHIQSLAGRKLKVKAGAKKKGSTKRSAA